MKIKEITNKIGDPYITKNKKKVYECKFETGDEFIPLENKLIKKTYNGIDNYYLICRVRDKNKNKILLSKADDMIFVKLTHNQMQQIKFLLNKNTNLTQVLFFCYEYISKRDKNKYVGIKNKSPLFLEPAQFEDFD